MKKFKIILFEFSKNKKSEAIKQFWITLLCIQIGVKDYYLFEYYRDFAGTVQIDFLFFFNVVLKNNSR